MDIFVDYDNIEKAVRRLGPEHVIRKVAATLEDHIDRSITRLDFRLYGGWYDGRNLTRTAQLLGAELRKTFPLSLVRKDTTPLAIANAYLAVTLLCDPRTAITHTFRRRSLSPNVKCEISPFRDCIDKAVCPLSALSTFLGTSLCPTTSCTVMPADILYKDEQKMVDSMIVTDVLEYPRVGPICGVVSSDDDIWPGIKRAVTSGAVVLHVETKNSSTRSAPFKSLPSSNYQNVRLV